jgi:hypothetical protein
VYKFSRKNIVCHLFILAVAADQFETLPSDNQENNLPDILSRSVHHPHFVLFCLELTVQPVQLEVPLDFALERQLLPFDDVDVLVDPEAPLSRGRRRHSDRVAGHLAVAVVEAARVVPRVGVLRLLQHQRRGVVALRAHLDAALQLFDFGDEFVAFRPVHGKKQVKFSRFGTTSESISGRIN